MIDKNIVYKYLGYNPKENSLTPDIIKIVDEAISEVENLKLGKYIFSPILPVINNDTICIGDLKLEGEDIKSHLDKCDKGVLLAVTLGNSADNIIRKYETTNMAYAVTIEAAFNVAIEDIANTAEETFRKELKEDGLYLTDRFSPGYGDLPISIQNDILNYTDARRKIGLTVTSSGILIPRKSITAIMGIASFPVKGKLADCKKCILKQKCIYLKRGTKCNL